MSAPFRELENRVRGLLRCPVGRELVSRYAKENPKAANDPHLVMHALIAPPRSEGREARRLERARWLGML
jgi:hypothetical protein